jgi:hypothetical protein
VTGSAKRKLLQLMSSRVSSSLWLYGYKPVVTRRKRLLLVKACFLRLTIWVTHDADQELHLMLLSTKRESYNIRMPTSCHDDDISAHACQQWRLCFTQLCFELVNGWHWGTVLWLALNPASGVIGLDTSGMIDLSLQCGQQLALPLIFRNASLRLRKPYMYVDYTYW